MVERMKPDDCDLDDIEEQFLKEQSKTGYESGLLLGRKQGHEEGYSQGTIEGAKRGSEIGFYKGFSTTWIHILQSRPTQTAKSTRIMNDLSKVLDLIDDFPKSNETNCEEKLLSIRIKFKQTVSTLNVRIEESYSSKN